MDAKSSVRWIRVADGAMAGGELLLSPGTVPWQDEMAAGCFEPFVYDALRASSLEGSTVWDVGAHIGYHTLGFAALVGPAGRVIAFEPNLQNLERLGQNLARNPQLSARVGVEGYAL